MEAIRERSLAWGDGMAEGSKLASASAADYASTTYSMISAGLEAEAAMNATAQAMLLAKGTMGDSKDAADLLAIAYNTMGDKSVDSYTELQRLSDIVAKTQAAFQIANLNQLNDGLKYGIPVAQKYGIEWAELSTIIGQLNTSGLTGSLAGTAFSSMMAQMLTASDSLGFEIAYEEDGGVSVVRTLENIRAKFGEIKDFSPKVQQAFDKAFGQEGSRALTLLSTSLDTLDDSLVAVTESEGQTALMAGRMSDSFEAQTEQLENARASMQARLGTSTNRINSLINGVKINFYNLASSILDSKVGGALGTIFTAGTMTASSLLSVGGTALNVAANLATFVAMTSQAGGMMAILKTGASLLATPFSMLGSFAMSAGKAIWSIVPKMGAWIASAWSAAAAHWALLGPIGLVIAAVAALAAGAYLVIKHWDSITAFFSKMWDGVKNVFSTAWDWIKKGFFAWFDAITAPIKWVGKALGKVGDWLGFGKDEDPLADMAASVESSTALSDAVQAKTEEAGAFLPHSDAEKGAFSALTASGYAIPETMAEGMSMNNALELTAQKEADKVAAKVIEFPKMHKIESFAPAYAASSSGTSQQTGFVPSYAASSAKEYYFTPSENFSQESSEFAESSYSQIWNTEAFAADVQPSEPALPDFYMAQEAEPEAYEIQKLIALVEELVVKAKERDKQDNAKGIVINNLNMPDIDSVDDMVRFVRDLQDQLDKESA